MEKYGNTVSEKRGARKSKSRTSLLATLTGQDEEGSSVKGHSSGIRPEGNRKGNFKNKNNAKYPTGLIPSSVAKNSKSNRSNEGGNGSWEGPLSGSTVEEPTGGDLMDGNDDSEIQASGSNKYLAKSDNGSKRKRAVHLGGNSEPRKRPRERTRERLGESKKKKKPSEPSNANLTFTEKGTPNGSYKEYKRRRVIDANDPRLKLLRADWLPSNGGGRVLDIGCNDGALTLHVARRYPNAHVLGVDIDEQLVQRADQRRNDVTTANKKGGSTATKPGGVSFPCNLNFMVEDVCTSHEGEADKSALKAGRYDLITMMSVSKWLHMKSGDEGLKRIFGRVRDSLVPGGVFVLEPQPTKSYKAARRKGAVAANLTMDKFKLRPEKFAEYLVEECGFERMEQLRDKLPKNTPFGTRPVMAFFKAKTEAGEHDEQL